MATQANDFTKPFKEALNPYLNAGWTGVLPLYPQSKVAPPKGTTGIAGVDPDEEDLSRFVDRGGNICLRMPKNVIGLDVDAYGGKVGGKTLMEASKRLGELPATWTSSRHADLSKGRTMLFIVPDGTSFIKGLQDVDVIQNTHRYLTAPPSIIPVDPVTGKHIPGGKGKVVNVEYKWYAPGGSQVPGLIVPEIEDLAELPASWMEELKLTAETSPAVPSGSIEYWDANLDWLPGGRMCSALKENTRYYVAGYRTAKSRHDFTMQAITKMVHNAASGHTGIFSALDELRGEFIRRVADDRGLEVAKHEFDSMVSWAVKLVFDKNCGYAPKNCSCNLKPKSSYKKQWKQY